MLCGAFDSILISVFIKLFEMFYKVQAALLQIKCFYSSVTRYAFYSYKFLLSNFAMSSHFPGQFPTVSSSLNTFSKLKYYKMFFFRGSLLLRLEEMLSDCLLDVSGTAVEVVNVVFC